MKFLTKNTKIISTFGPSVTFGFGEKSDRNDPEVKELIERIHVLIEDLIYSGINCVRFNFSHGSSDENMGRIMMINEVQQKLVDRQNGKYRFLRPIVFLADTKGPEIRIYDMGSGVSYQMGQEITVFCTERKQGSSEGFSVMDVTGRYNMANDCVVGNLILVEDGKATLEILSVDKDKGLVRAKIKNSYTIRSNRRINLSGADYTMEFLSEKDANDIKFSLDQGFEYVALSFANSRQDVQSVKDLIDSYCKEKDIPNIMQVFSKVETLKSCNNIDEIIEASDGIMIARGDLGLEIPYYVVPYWTKSIIRKCRINHKPSITATQMLDSLERNVVATRAEVSDVYRAAEMGSDCTMLSGETAQGMFPVLAVKTMTNIVYESEKHFNYEKFLRFFMENSLSKISEKNKNRCEGLLYILSNHHDIKAIVLVSSDVDLEFLKAVSAMRLKVPLFSFISVPNVSVYCSKPNWSCPNYRKVKKAVTVALHRGINPVLVSGLPSDDRSMLPEVFAEFVANMSTKSDFKEPLNKIVYFDSEEWKIS